MIGDFDRLWRCMEHYYKNCGADEEIGFATALKYLRYVIKREGNKEQTNLHIENRELKRRQYEQQRVVNKLNLQLDDLKEDNIVLQQRIDRMNRVKQY